MFRLLCTPILFVFPLVVGAADLGSPVLDRLDPKGIPDERRFADQPAEFVGVLGESLAYHGDGMHGINNLGFSPEGRFLVIASVGTIKLWDLRGSSARKYGEIDASVGRGFCWGFTPGGRSLVVLSKRGLTLWDLAADAPQKAAESKWTGAATMSIAPDGKAVAVGFLSGSVQVFDLVGKEFKPRFEVRVRKGGVDRVAFSPDSKAVASGGFEGNVQLWDMNGKPVNEWKLPGGHTWTLQFSPDNALLVTNSSAVVSNFPQVLDLAGASQKKTVLKSDVGRVRGAVFVRDGKELATLSGEGKIIFWGARTFARLREWKLPTKTNLDMHNLAVSPDGRHLAAVDQNSLVYVFRMK